MPRTYTFVSGEFSLAKAAKAIAAGRTFVTTGPLLIAAIDKNPPGSAFSAGPKTRVLSVEAWASGRDSGALKRIEVLRNGQIWREFTLEGKPGSIQTNLNLLEQETSWYCVRVFGPERQTAVSGAFYFADKSHRPPQPVRAQVRAQILDAKTDVHVPAVLAEVTLSGTVAREGRRHRLQTGEARVYVPGTARLRAEARGYAPMTLSPFLDSPDLVKTVTTFCEQDLSNWQSFDQLKRQLDNVDLVFRLQKTSP
jgi:hypothetical protein